MQTRALVYRDRDYVRGTRPVASLGEFENPLLPSQFYDEHHCNQLGPEERLFLSVVLQAVEDWWDIFAKGSVAHSRRRNFTLEDALELADYLFSDVYGSGDPTFIPLRDICKALVIDIHVLRAGLSKIGARADLLNLPLLTDAQLIARNRDQPRNKGLKRQAVAA